MGHIENVFERCMKKDAEGRRVFYPFGIFGPGRVITDTALEGRLLRLLKRVQYIGVPVLAAVAGVSNYIWPAIAVYLAVYYAGAYRILSGCPASAERLTLRDYVGNSARAGLAAVWLSVLAGVIMLSASVGMIVLADTPGERFAGVACALFFGFFEAVAVWALSIKYAMPRSAAEK